MKMDDFDRIMALILDKEPKEEEPSQSGSSQRVVLLPRELDETLDELAGIKDETNGVLLYRLQEGKSGRYCPAVALYMTAKETPGHVKAEPQRMEVVNEFFQRHPDFRFVKWHTHSRGTIRMCGEYFATHFSGADTSDYDRRIEEEPSFIGMVATPVTKLLYAHDNPRLKVIENFSEGLSAQISEELIGIAQSKGYDLPPFITKRKRRM